MSLCENIVEVKTFWSLQKQRSINAAQKKTETRKDLEIYNNEKEEAEEIRKKRDENLPKDKQKNANVSRTDFGSPSVIRSAILDSFPCSCFFWSENEESAAESIVSNDPVPDVCDGLQKTSWNSDVRNFRLCLSWKGLPRRRNWELLFRTVFFDEVQFSTPVFPRRKFCLGTKPYKSATKLDFVTFHPASQYCQRSSMFLVTLDNSSTCIFYNSNLHSKLRYTLTFYALDVEMTQLISNLWWCFGTT